MAAKSSCVPSTLRWRPILAYLLIAERCIQAASVQQIELHLGHVVPAVALPRGAPA